MIKRTIKQIRPNTSVQFVNIMSNDQTLISEEVKTYIVDNYVTTNKVTFEGGVESVDGLELTLVKNWADHAAIESYYSDPYIINNLITPRTTYMEQNNILTSLVDEVL